jgi:hypothetical protein
MKTYRQRAAERLAIELTDKIEQECRPSTADEQRAVGYYLAVMNDDGLTAEERAFAAGVEVKRPAGVRSETKKQVEAMIREQLLAAERDVRQAHVRQLQRQAANANLSAYGYHDAAAIIARLGRDAWDWEIDRAEDAFRQAINGIERAPELRRMGLWN